MPAFKTWEVLEWLRIRDRQDLDKWPEVLGVFCHSYIKMINANIVFDCLPDRNRVHELLDETHKSNASSPLPKHARGKIHEVLIDLLAMAEAYGHDWKIYNRKALALIEDLDEPARYRGLFLHIGGGYLYGGSGQRDIVDGNHWQYLSSGTDAPYSTRGYIGRMTTTKPWGAAGASKSPYHCFLFRNTSGHNVFAESLEARLIRSSNPPSNTRPAIGTFAADVPYIRSLPGLGADAAVADIWAIPGGWPDKPDEVWLYVATGTKIIELELNEDGILECRGWRSHDVKAPVSRVRCVYPESVSEDPDGHIKTSFNSIDPQVHTLTHYGGLASSPDVLVIRHEDGLHGYVPAPWGQYAGIGVDERFLWVFTSGGFACATHTSVMNAAIAQARGDKAAKPRWSTHYPNALLYRGLPTGDELVEPRTGVPVLQGLLDLAPCSDGTLTASVVTRSYDQNGNLEGDDGPYMYTASYSIDVVAGTLKVNEWTKLAGGPAEQIQKHPIYCWPMFEGLKARLAAESQLDAVPALEGPASEAELVP
jgi:hypothetical protein